MAGQILHSKLTIPPSPPRVIRRERLLRQLRQALSVQITLLIAPAGSGKTSLLTSWLAHVSPRWARVAWLQVDDLDNKPWRFWSHVLSALHELVPDPEQSSSWLVYTAKEPDPDELTAAVTALVERVGRATLLVLDDYHLVHAQGVHDTLAFLIDHLPHPLHIVLSTREEPPLPLARWRIRGQLGKITSRDVAFTEREIRMFFEQKFGVELSSEASSQLWRRSEGWVAGLQLAGLALRGGNEPEDLFALVSGSQHSISGFLAEQVLSQQPKDIQDFLLVTSLLDRLTGGLCDALSGRSDGQEMLATLERLNLFILPLDEQGLWYRYHTLFAGFLRSRLSALQPERLDTLYSQASTWCQEAGLLDDAVNYALRARDFDRAADIANWVAFDLREKGEAARIVDWLNAIPDHLLRSQPFLNLNQAWALAMTGRFAEVDEWARLAESHPEDAWAKHPPGHTFALGQQKPSKALARDMPSPQSACEMLRAYVAYWSDTPQDVIPHVERALQGLDSSLQETRTYCRILQGGALFQLGNHQEARAVLEEALETSRRLLYATGVTAAVHRLGALERQETRLAQALELYQDSLEFTRVHAGRPPGDAEHLGIGEVLLERNSLELAASHLNAARQTAERTQDPFALRLIYPALARLHYALRDIPAAATFLDKTEVLIARFQSPLAIRQVEVLRARLLASQFRPGNGRLATLPPEGHEEIPPLAIDGLGVAICHLMLATGEIDRALETLEGLPERLLVGHRLALAMEALVLRAVARELSKNAVAASLDLRLAIDLGQEGGFVRTFIEAPGPIDQMLQRAHDTGSEYAGILAEARRSENRKRANGPASGSKPDSTSLAITERELEVLRLMAGGMSNRDIAQSLFLTTGTVKVHVHQILTKMGVHSRTQAVAQARSRSLL